jgi:hypothetical protein
MFALFSLKTKRALALVLVLGFVAAGAASADPAPFDLTGPPIEMTVTRGAVTLPVAQVPNLAAGDKVWLKADLSASQSAHYLLVATFLRGSTDPPPANWFSRCETWSGKCAEKGLTLSVPKDAQQLLVFLAPETGGDFKTLVDAVRGRPGVFVRSSQDLNQAQLDHARLEAYLAAIRALGESDPARLKEAAPLLARSLAIKVDPKCLDQNPQLQASCLMQGRESLILSDGHSASITQELTSGAASDLAMEASNTPQMKSGFYGPYIGSLIDIARLFDSFHTAQYQYIPALASVQGQRLALALNAPPSFHDPKSVLVLALPAIAQPQFPPLHAVDPKETYCARKEPLVLPIDGAPLVFATDYAHGMTLSVTVPGAKTFELPATADAARGGFVIDTSALHGASLGSSVHASLHGTWGFDRYEGPGFELLDAREQGWALGSGEESALIVGREDTVHLRAGSASCIADITLQDAAGKPLKLDWKALGPDGAELKLFLENAEPGELTLLVRQYGSTQPQRLALRAYSEGGHLDAFTLHTGDRQGILRGTRLDKVDKLVVNEVEFVPATLANSAGHDELTMQMSTANAAAGLTTGESAMAHVTLRDGRVYDVKTLVESPRPSAVLIGKSAHGSTSGAAGNIRLGNQDELPQDAQLTFALRAQSPASFSHDDKVEVATSDGSSSTVLDFSNGAMTLESSKVAVATLDPAKGLGSSAFGPLRYRVVSSGVVGDWRPLATVVRLPVLQRLECPGGASKACRLSGANLFLLESVAGDAQFTQPTPVPDGYTEQSLSVPRPTEGQLFVKLRDDPSVINVATLDVQVAAPAATTTPTAPPPAQSAAPGTSSPSPPVPPPTDVKASQPTG